VTSSDFVCDACGKTFPVGDLRTWRQEELVQAAPGAAALAAPGAIRSRGLTPVTRSVYAMREYRLCPACFTDVSEPLEQDMEYQRRGVLVVAVIGLIVFIAVMIAAAMHSDLFRSPHDQHRGALGAMPTPYKNPLPTIPTAGN
jgi:hypothetical protein